MPVQCMQREKYVVRSMTCTLYDWARAVIPTVAKGSQQITPQISSWHTMYYSSTTAE